MKGRERLRWGLACCAVGALGLVNHACAETTCEETRTCPGASTGGSGGGGGAGGSGGIDAGGTGGIPPVGSYGISVAQSSLTVMATKTVDVDVTVTRNDMTDPITLELMGLPANVTSNPVVASSSDTSVKLTISAGFDVPHGTSPLTLRATAKLDVKTVPIDLLVRGLPGSLDLTFGSKGEVLGTIFGDWSKARCAALAPDGSFYVAGDTGSTAANTHAYFLARYDSSGKLDSTFGQGGAVVRYTTPASGEHVARGVVLDSQQRPVVAGYFTGNQIHVARFDTSGVLDPTFGTAGEVTGPGGNMFALVNAGAKLVAAGKDDKTPAHALVGRIGSDGKPDTAFGAGSFATVDTTTYTSEAVAAAIDADNKIVVAGNTNKPGATTMVARFTPGGAADAFGTSGIAWLNPPTGGVATGLAVRPDKRAVVGGASTGDKWFLFQLDAQGAPDASFGTAGQTTGTEMTIDAFALDANGHIVAAGRSGQWLRVSRLTPAGAIDTTFGVNGTFDASTASATPRAVLMLPDGRALIVGATSSEVYLARIWM